MKNEIALYLGASTEVYVRKANTLIQLNRFISQGQGVGNSMSLLEQKIYNYSLSLLDSDSEELHPVKFDIKDFWNALDKKTNSKKYETLITDALQKLTKRSGWVLKTNPENGEKELVLVQLICKPKITNNGKTVEISFDPDTKDALVNLKNNFTHYPIGAGMKLRSKHGYALFELLCSYEYMQRPLVFSFAELEENLDATKMRSDNFKSKVIETAIADINKNSNVMHVTCEYIKTGRAITHVKFYIEKITEQHLSVGKQEKDASEIRREQAEKQTKKQIDYDALLFDIQAGKLPYKEETLQLILEVMSSTLNSPQQTFRINNCQISAYKVQAEFEKLNMFHIQHILDKLENAAKDIKNPRAYIRSMLFNAPATMDVLVQSQINSDNAKINDEPHPQQPVPDQWELDEIQRYLSAPI